MKKIGTLEVWLDEEDDSQSSGTTYSALTPKDNTITLRPKGDKGASKYGNDMVSILAHELGHFVGNILKTKVQLKAGWPYTTPEQQFAAEKEAWRVADIIKPGLKGSAIEKDALSAYKYGVRKYPGKPLGLLRMLGLVG